MIAPTLALLLVLAAPPPPPAEVTVESLLAEMADLDRLARPADYTCRQFSSYDRRSRTPDDADGWFANGDAGNYLRVEEGGEHVLAEAQGPGAIVRIWSANPGGRIRIWLDGAVALEADFAALTRGAVAPFAEPFAGVRGRGHNLYFPFPYARSMKVTTSQGGQYYHVNYRTYPKGTPVRTYVGPPPGEALKRAAEKLGAPGARPGAADGMPRPLSKLTLEGPGTITRLGLEKVEGDPRKATIRIWFDGELCVCAPLADFFGTAPGEHRYAALPLGTWYCAFPMPFSESARIEVDGAAVEGVVDVRGGEAGPLRFHAWWHGAARVSTRPFKDWAVLHGFGRGRYVGTALSIRNPVRIWWGEGDEKISVDGEAFPSTFGTGTEDYFGYAWCDTALFQHPYHSQSRCDGPGNRGDTAVNRFHIIDDIPFQRSIRFDLELWHWGACEVSFATVAYWYAEPGFKHPFPEAPAAERERIGIPEPRAVPGAIEGEALEVVAASGGVAGKQDLAGFGEGLFSRDEHLWWRGAKPGDRLRLRFQVPAGDAGRRRLVLALTKAPDYGIHRLTLNGAALGPAPVDLHAARVEPAGEVAFDVDLPAGANELAVEIVGTNPRAAPANYMFGIDYLRIEASPR